MKKLLFSLFTIFLLTSCSAFKVLDINKLRLGMSKNEAKGLFGDPQKILFAAMVDGGQEEVLQYVTATGETYVLTFFNDKLEHYGFVEDKKPINGNPHHMSPSPNNNGNSPRPNRRPGLLNNESNSQTTNQENKK